jgi:hypothetical protein
LVAIGLNSLHCFLPGEERLKTSCIHQFHPLLSVSILKNIFRNIMKVNEVWITVTCLFLASRLEAAPTAYVRNWIVETSTPHVSDVQTYVTSAYSKSGQVLTFGSNNVYRIGNLTYLFTPKASQDVRQSIRGYSHVSGIYETAPVHIFDSQSQGPSFWTSPVDYMMGGGSKYTKTKSKLYKTKPEKSYAQRRATERKRSNKKEFNVPDSEGSGVSM